MTQKLDRRSVLAGALAGAAVGGGVGLASGLAARSAPAATGDICGDARGKVSYAQIGEDLVVAHILITRAKITGPTYLDIGAYDPVHNNNTYLLYRSGGRGVLVEPNPTYAARIRAQRPNDIVLEAGIGTTTATEADYYVIRGDGQHNTFSKEQADKLVKLHGPSVVERVIKMPLFTVGAVLARYFERAPDFVSTDVEGLDLAILRTFDFDRYRPRVVCVETSDVETGETEQEILDLMRDKGYAVRGGNLVNTIFVGAKRPAARTSDG
jgi:FkbM family methyltransferase